MTIRIGIIGTGIMGMAVGQVLKRLPNAELVALANTSQPRLKAAGRQLGIKKLHADYREMLRKEKLDAVAVATPDHFHKPPVLDALHAGCHVLVEKPMTTSQADAEEIYHAVKKTGRKLQVSFNHRWLAPYHKIKEMIAAGQLGEPLMAYARKNNPLRVPTEMIAAWSARTTPAWFLSSHDIDLVNWWFAVNPVEVYARGVKKVLVAKGFDTYDAIHALVTYEGGRFATFESTWIYPNTSPYGPDSFMQVVGTKGTTQLDRKAEAIDAMLPEAFVCPRTFLNYKVFDEWQGAFPACVRAFLHAIENDTEPHVNARDGVLSTAVLAALHQSLFTGKAEKIRITI